MEDQTSESGFELVLDNRKLIVVFLLLITVCGGFFVLGFIEGKRQGLQEGSLASAEDTSVADYGMRDVPSIPGSELLNESAEETRRNLLESGGGLEEKTDTAPPTIVSPPSEDARASLPQSEPAGKLDTRDEPGFTASTAYSVQVGAFRRQPDAEKQAEVIRSKGYDCRIESPSPPQQLFLLKVGKFNTRAEAVAMQLRLKQSGFASFIKTD